MSAKRVSDTVTQEVLGIVPGIIGRIELQYRVVLSHKVLHVCSGWRVDKFECLT